MLKIGDFSKLTRISIRMLRHYNEIGLLIPEEIDRDTDYRYYAASQLPTAELIQVLKNMGFGLAMVKEVLDKYEHPEELERFLLLQKQELASREESLRQQMRLLDSTIRWLRKDGNMMNYHVNLKTLPERSVASVRQIIPAYTSEGMLWGIMMQETAAMNLQVPSPSYNTTIFHDKEYKESDVDVEIQHAVTGSYPDTEHVTFKTAPAVLMASVTFQGAYEQITAINEAIVNWVTQNGYEFNGPSFWIYHVSPGETKNPEEYVTEVCYPVQKKQ